MQACLKGVTARKNCRETVTRVYQRSHMANDDAIKPRRDDIS
jgi:hypothetical protein